MGASTFALMSIPAERGVEYSGRGCREPFIMRIFMAVSSVSVPVRSANLGINRYIPSPFPEKFSSLPVRLRAMVVGDIITFPPAD